MILRKTYLDRIIPLIDKNLIKVLMGVRRSGKTVLLQQIGEYLVANGRSKDNIVYINFESKANAKFKNADVLYDFLIGAARAAKGKVYILLDEIQSVEKWEEVASSLLVDIDCDIYITGSNSKLLSGELATLIAGRYIQIKVLPFTFAEAKELTIKNGTFTSDEKLFADYLRRGGLPQRFSLEDVSVGAYLSDTYDAIVIKDVLQRNRINDPGLLTALLNFLMDNIANPFSARSITAALAANGIKTTTDTVLNYIEYIKNAMIVTAAPRYDIKGKRLLSSQEKYYAVDLGLRNTAASSDKTRTRLYRHRRQNGQLRDRFRRVQRRREDLSASLLFARFRADNRPRIRQLGTHRRQLSQIRDLGRSARLLEKRHQTSKHHRFSAQKMTHAKTPQLSLRGLAAPVRLEPATPQDCASSLRLQNKSACVPVRVRKRTDSSSSAL